jgi:hypothetical protein
LSQGVHPAEWIFPVVGAHHVAYNAAVQAGDQPDAKLTTPDSKQDRENDEQAAFDAKYNEAQTQAQMAAQAAEDERRAGIQTPQQDLESRRRARISASQTLSGSRRSASQTLTDTSSLGV